MAENLKEVGIRLVAKDETTYSQSVKEAAATTLKLTNEIQKLVEAQASTIEGARYIESWKQMLGQLDAEYVKFWEDAGRTEQAAIVASSQRAEEYTRFWQEALAAREQTEQENTVKQAQATQEYVKFWEEALNERSRLEQEATVISAQEAAKYVQFWEQALNAKDRNGRPTGSIFDDPEKAKAMQENNARIAAEALAAAQNIVTEATQKSTSASMDYVEQLKAQGFSAQEAAKIAKDLGIQNVILAESELTDAEAAKIVEATHKRVSQTYADQEKQIKLLTNATNQQAGSHSRLTESAVTSSRAFFALTLASFGLMSITQELKKSFGDDLPVAFEKTSSAVQQIASFGSAGAFVGGVPGAILGGIAGGILAITTAAVTLDPVLQQLNTQLDNMSKRDELVSTLADVADISNETAKTWLDAARADPNFAEYLEEIIEKGQPLPGLLATIQAVSKELTGTFDGLGHAIGDAGDATNKILLLIAGVAVAEGQLFNSLLAGKNIVEAVTDAQGAMRDVIMEVERATQGMGLSQDQVSEATRRANEILKAQEDILKDLKKAQEDYADAVNDAGLAQSKAFGKVGEGIQKSQEKYLDDVQNAATQRQNSIANSEQTLTNRIADLWQDLGNRVADINSQLADKVFDINQNLANRIADITMQLGNRVSDIQQDLGNRLSDINDQLGEQVYKINQDLDNKLRDLAHKRDDDITKANQKIADAARDLARELYEIERNRLNSIEALAFNTHEQLQDARTSHDRDRIIRRAQFEQSQIDQQANDARRDALMDYDDKVNAAEQEKQLARDTYEFEVQLARRLADQKIEEANRSAAIQRAQAERDAAQQIAQAERNAAQQRAIAEREAAQNLAQAEREAAQQLELANRRHQQEVAAAQRAYAQQVEDARKAEAQKLADAQKAMEERNRLIAEAYAKERQEILNTLAVALAAYKLIIDSINLSRTHLEGFRDAYQDFIDDPLGLKNLDPNKIPSPMFPKIPEVPSIGGLGEMFKPVNAPSINTSSRNVSITVPIYDATDPVKVGEQVRRVMQDTLGGYQ